MGRDEDYRRYVNVNLPHARTIVHRIGRSLEALGGLGEPIDAGAPPLMRALDALEEEARPHDDDPPIQEALAAADRIAACARALVSAIVETPLRGDRLGQHVRNLFECLGLAEEGAVRSLECGELPDSPLR
jgi:hypothetical protein